ncbi:Lhr family helicase [Corynebacterium gerontici]|nr:DEAD/DEAH box helicase [Corynebacterium gerontici]
MSNVPSESILTRFRPQVATWFQEVFEAPTAVQEQAWSHISAGEHALVVAPTGSGKTLAAFLWALNGLVEAPGQTALPTGHAASKSKEDGAGVKVLYISPLKALGVDVENNLRAPLNGINHVAARLGLDHADITVGVRSGDTPQAERSRQVRRPPDILITTPESAYLMLTSKAGGILKSVETVIIDEIHALAGTKRGVHLALTLERLERTAEQPIQRIGLSATVRPLDTVAKFLGGDRPVQIVDPPLEKRWQLDVHVPVDDMSDLPTPEPGSTIGEATIDDPLGLMSPLDEAPGGEPGGVGDGLEDGAEAAAMNQESALPQQGSIWPFIEQEVFDEVMAHRSTLVFVNSRRTAERLTSRLNELHAMQHAPETLSPQLRRTPAQLMKASDVAGQAPPVIARAHHGSVSKDERALTETMLKEGALKAVVATSSLELGIDMGAVELVIQVESPPSVASGLQRVGRAGHVVGAVSKGSFYPKHRSDLVQSAVTVRRMREGLIEELSVPMNPLDVLVQQTVAAVSMEDLDVDEWYATVLRSYPYRDLAREVFNAVIDLASGVYPSTDFAELRPRITFDRITGVMSARPGAQRVAVTSGGTIPDRGMFGVFLVGGEGVPRRVGELDEEMVYESRVGDIFTLGASSWRIEEITRDQVLVTPAPGHTGRLPFWSGDQAGRPAELGAALGAFRRHVLANPEELDGIGLDERARRNLVAFLQEQREATGIVPDEQTLVLERFRDELGDWRVVLHTPYGRGVNAAWALAVGARIAQETGMDAQAVSSDDGIVLRLPEAEQEPSASVFVVDPDEIEDIVAEQVGNSALFASRFRECAARALLLPRKNPGKRAPLWQQRQRAAQLLDVARKYPSFPIILETVRECLKDVYDLPALQSLLRAIALRKVRIAEVTTQQPSPFASSILFNYTGAFMYEGDSPLAEKRAAALALDPALLAKLLGTVELRNLLDPEIITEVDERLRRVAPDRQARTPEELADALRVLGPVPVEQLSTIAIFGDSPDDVHAQAIAALGDRVMTLRIAGVPHLAQVLDAPLLRDALGVPVPPGVAAQVETIPDALEQLVARWSRTRGPFVLGDLQRAFGLAAGVAHTVLGAFEADGRLVTGHFRQGIDESEYVAPEVLKTIRSRSLAAARAETQPVSPSAYGRFLPAWQQVATMGTRPEAMGADGVFAVIEQLAGVRLPASAWETLVLPQRVRNYSPLDLDELTASGEVLVVGAGSAGAADPWVMLLPSDYAAELMPEPAEMELSHLQTQLLEVMRHGGSFLFAALREEVSGEDLGLVTGTATDLEIREALWGLFEAGLVSPDSFTPIRARLAAAGGGGKASHRARRTPNRSRLRMGRTSFAQAQRAGQPEDMKGRWAMAPQANSDATARSVAHGEAWLDRYGVVTRGSVVAEDVLGGFALAYRVLTRFEESGKAMRGYIIEGLGGAQFSTPAVIDWLRGLGDTPDVEGWPSGTKEPAVVVLAACDPANPYGAALPWPEVQGTLSRSAGAVVVLIDGLLAAHLTRGGKTLTLLDPPPGISQEVFAQLVVQALSQAVGQNMLSRLVIEKVNGEAALTGGYVELMRGAGASITPRGIRIAGQPVDTGSGARRGRDLSSALEDVPFNGQTGVNPDGSVGEKGLNPFRDRGPKRGGYGSGGWRR